MRNGVREKSRRAVAAAEQRSPHDRGAPSGSAGAWTSVRGKTNGPWRPGKTAAKRGGRK